MNRQNSEYWFFVLK